MRRLMMTTASLALVIGAAACSSTPPPAPAPEPEVVEEPVVVEEPEVITEVIPEITGPVPGSLDDFQVNVGDRVFFDLDQYRLTADAQSVLQRQAAWLASYQMCIRDRKCPERGRRRRYFFFVRFAR